jgi:hypothetical protein
MFSVVAMWLKFFVEKRNQDRKRKAFWFVETPNGVGTIV